MRDYAIRRAVSGDEEVIVELLGELAAYEKLTHKFKITRDIAARDFIGEHAPLKVDLLFEGDRPAGIATWYFIYSSFAAGRGLYLEDLFVRPHFRGRGFGKALLAHLARLAREANAVKITWAVLDWNKPSIAFYESLGAEPVREWYVYSLSGDALTRLGA
jgi:GNAT superfamily N-acetyltransferase